MAEFAGNLAGFNAEDVPPQDSFDPIPAGWYPVVITDSEFKPTRDGTGEYLEITFSVIEGEYEGRKVWDRLNLSNKNQTAVEIAQRSLSSICRAVGVMAPNDSSELHDRPLEIKVSVRPAKGEYEPSNDVKGYRALGAASAAVSAPPSTGAARAPRAAAGAQRQPPPWKRS